MVIYHRTVATLINTLIEHGLSLDKIIEPQSNLAGIEKMPDLINESRSPSFIIIKSKKIIFKNIIFKNIYRNLGAFIEL